MTQAALTNDIDTFVTLKDNLKPRIIEYVQDTTLPLDERWAVFYKASRLGLLPCEIWCDFHIRLLGNRDLLRENFYLSKGVDMTYADFYDELQNLKGDVTVAIDFSAIDGWKEAVLASGKGYGCYDW